VAEGGLGHRGGRVDAGGGGVEEGFEPGLHDGGHHELWTRTQEVLPATVDVLGGLHHVVPALEAVVGGFHEVVPALEAVVGGLHEVVPGLEAV